eukprot:Nitzschia sp. Nitz4//scaffold160_size51814//31136//31798//NITZ4_006914-RA/size51814-processed-gene-0.54-mRNA-1//1//CDS//3329537857//3394//frame0
MSKSVATASGQSLWSKVPKTNAELFALTYGALVTEVLRDLDQNLPQVNQQLEQIGYSIGIRCVDEFLAKAATLSTAAMGTSNPSSSSTSAPPASSNRPSSSSSLLACKSLADTAEVLGRTAFKMFLGITADVQHHSPTAFSLIFVENPLATFVELPESMQSTLEYNNLYCGVVRGALEMLQYKVQCTFVQSPLRGDETHEIRVELLQVLQDGAGEDYHEE